MSGNPSTPSNVVPMPTNWPGPMFTPKSWPQSPSCFSELASLNACYDSIQMMEQILAKVMTDLVTNNVAVQQAIVEAIAKSGSNVPLIGVTNGSAAQPGQVGEFVQWSGTGTIPVTQGASQSLSTLVLQPGDWDMESSAIIMGDFTTFGYYLNPIPPGASGNGETVTSMGISVPSPPAIPSGWESVTAPRIEINITAPTLLVFTINTNFSGATTAAGSFNFNLTCRRMR